MSCVDYHPPPEVSAAINQQLLEALRQHPGASGVALARMIGRSSGAAIGRLRRLGRDGVLIRCVDGRWRLPTPGERVTPEIEEDKSEFDTVERARPPFDPSRWVQNVDFYLVFDPGPFACARYG